MPIRAILEYLKHPIIALNDMIRQPFSVFQIGFSYLRLPLWCSACFVVEWLKPSHYYSTIITTQPLRLQHTYLEAHFRTKQDDLASICCYSSWWPNRKVNSLKMNLNYRMRSVSHKAKQTELWPHGVFLFVFVFHMLSYFVLLFLHYLHALVSSWFLKNDIEAVDPRGRTPLHLAVSLGHLESVRVLLQHNASVTKENASNWTG